jgi:RNA polymerase sigma-70 factor, ECF subfamily
VLGTRYPRPRHGDLRWTRRLWRSPAITGRGRHRPKRFPSLLSTTGSDELGQRPRRISDVRRHASTQTVVAAETLPSYSQPRRRHPISNGSVKTADFRALYEELCPLVWRWVARLGIPVHAIEDVVQETFLTIYAKFDAFEGRAALTTWAFAVTIRVTRNYQRRRSVGPVGDESDVEELDALPAEATHPETAAEQAESLSLLQRILNELDVDKREVFVLAELEQLSGPEIATILEISTNTVVSRLRVAREEVRAAWERANARDQWRLR